jgi:hypothetical protein
MAFFNFLDLKFTELDNQVNTFLKSVYSKTDETLSSASPFGQIVNVLKEFYQMDILYQKRIVNNFIIAEADNIKAIRNLARISGHNPTRAISATGTLRLKLKPGVDIFEDISGGKIKIKDKLKLKNKTNGLIYSIKLGISENNYQLSQISDIYLNIIQGTYESQNFTGTGKINQSYSVNIPTNNTVDNFEIEVKYNDQFVSIKDGIFDMLNNEIACVTRTGMNGGLDIYFGNGSFGFIPELATSITITYLLTDGINGQILTPQINDFQFLDSITDISGNNINIESTFDIIVDQNIDFASDGESINFTKSVLPYVSRNFVLSSPSQYIFHLKRLNMFSQINAYNTLNDNNYENDNKIFLFLVPKISNFFTGDVNYFNVPMEAFYLDETEKNKILTFLTKMGNIPTNTILDIIQPTISKYILNVYIRKYKGFSDDFVKQNIISEVSSYLSSVERDDRIVKSDLISLIDGIEGVDSTNIQFISKKNEDFHKLYPDSTTIYGLDTVLGDIIVDKNELFLIRGGWSDRNMTYYNETLQQNGLGPINIIFVGETEKIISN